MVYIDEINAQEVLDSRGNPTIQASILLSDNICTLSSFEFYIFFKYITILKKQPSKRIRLADYLSDSSVPHDIVVMHTVNNWY